MATASAWGIYIGSNVLNVPYDLGTKVANSKTECPIDFYEQDLADINSIPVPTDASWIKNISQEDIDLLKYNNSLNIFTKDTLLGTKTKSVLFEVDFSSICTKLYGGVNATFKSNILASTITMFANGMGYNSGASANGLTLKIWNGTAYESLGSNIDSAIQKQVLSFNNTHVNSSNKLYFVLHSTYPCYNEILRSSISISYMNLDLKLNKTADAISPITINLI